VRPFGPQPVHDELIGVDVVVGAVQLIEELIAAEGHDKGMAETVIGRVGRVRAIGDADAADDNVVVVRIGRIRGAIRIEAQRFAVEKPALAQIGRDRRDDRLLLVPRAVIEEALDGTFEGVFDETFEPPGVRAHERKIVGLHRVEALSGLHPAVHAITRIRRTILRGRRVKGRLGPRRGEDARGVMGIFAHHLVQGPRTIGDIGLGQAVRHIGNRHRSGRVGAGAAVRQKGGARGGEQQQGTKGVHCGTPNIVVQTSNGGRKHYSAIRDSSVTNVNPKC
jgi:hypothetical protein